MWHKWDYLIIGFVIILPFVDMAYIVWWSNLLERLNKGLPEDQQFQLIDWWTPSKRLRMFKRWRYIRETSKKQNNLA
jgi:hypothetical protein